MADVTYNISLRASRDNLDYTSQVSGVSASMNVTGMQSGTFPLSSTYATISTAALTSVGFAFLRNLSSSTATIVTAQFGIVTGGAFYPVTTLQPGDAAFMRLATGSVYGVRGESSARLRVDILEG